MKVSLKIVLLIVLPFLIISCKTDKKETQQLKKTVDKEVVLTKAEKIINKAIETHGGNLFDKASYSFIFRNKQYSFTNNKDSYRYSVIKQNDKKEEVVDVLDNGNFLRTVNGTKLELSKEDAARYGESLNSVIYFATLPHKLNDPAVDKSYKGETQIKGELYDAIQVTFKQEGGGKDFEDQYFYWIHKKTNTMDYLAYNYKVNGGGVRFRSSYNRRNVDGILFQDYINHKAEVGTPLAELPRLYEKNQLKEVSRIETENVKVLKN